MKKKLLVMSFLYCSILMGLLAFQSPIKITWKDCKPLNGKWTGTLTYLDYSSGKPYTMPAEMDIHRIGKTNAFLLKVNYPNEPSANGNDTLILTKNGTFINAEKIIAKKKKENGILEIITEERGKDGNDDQPAIFRHTYLIGKLVFNKKKEVQFENTSKWITRHEYTFIRKK